MKLDKSLSFFINIIEFRINYSHNLFVIQLLFIFIYDYNRMDRNLLLQRKNMNLSQSSSNVIHFKILLGCSLSFDLVKKFILMILKLI